MLPLPTLPTSTAAISLPGSGDGRLPSPLPDGPTARAASGPDHAHVNLSPRQARAAGLMTSGTFGPISIGSLTSVVLKSSLANKLRQRTDLDGSILYRLTLKDRDTPKLQSIFALRASARPTSDSAFTGSGWNTARATDGTNGGPNQAGGALSADAAITGPMRLTVTGELLTGSGAGTKSSGQLNPEHSRWLMGYPRAWARSMPGYVEWQKWQVLMALACAAPKATEPAP